MASCYSLPKAKLQNLIDALTAQGFQCVGPQVRDASVVYAPLTRSEQLPWGVADEQTVGSYQLAQGDQGIAFGWANSPSSIKTYLFKEQETLWKVTRDADGKLQFTAEIKAEPLALIGVRPCDIAAMLIQDEVFLNSRTVDQHYQAKRKALFTVVVNCAKPANSCFCVAAGGSPKAEKGFDLGMTELAETFVIEAGSEQGQSLLDQLELAPASAEQLSAAQQQATQAADAQTRTIPSPETLRSQPTRAADNPHWQTIAEQCIACGNCTQVCPTCFCHREMDLPLFDTEGNEHVRSWDSCFASDHGYTHGHNFRPDTANHYQQWLNHKFVWWHEQFGSSGCVGCGRCLSWCPAKVDLTENLEKLYEE